MTIHARPPATSITDTQCGRWSIRRRSGRNAGGPTFCADCGRGFEASPGPPPLRWPALTVGSLVLLLACLLLVLAARG